MVYLLWGYEMDVANHFFFFVIFFIFFLVRMREKMKLFREQNKL